MKIGKTYAITARGYAYVVRVLDQSAQFGKGGYQLEVLDKKLKKMDEIWLPTGTISRFTKLYKCQITRDKSNSYPLTSGTRH
jgi:hypothetical protein